jgi:hypothetical protein
MESLILLRQEADAKIQETRFLDSYNENKLFNGKPFCIEITLTDGRIDNFIKDPYIKLYADAKVSRQTPVARIVLREPKLVKHSGARGVRLTNAVLKDLTAAMNRQSCNKQYRGTVLEAINMFLTERARDNGLYYEPIIGPIDFTVIKYIPTSMDVKIC